MRSAVQAGSAAAEQSTTFFWQVHMRNEQHCFVSSPEALADFGILGEGVGVHAAAACWALRAAEPGEQVLAVEDLQLALREDNGPARDHPLRAEDGQRLLQAALASLRICLPRRKSPQPAPQSGICLLPSSCAPLLLVRQCPCAAADQALSAAPSSDPLALCCNQAAQSPAPAGHVRYSCQSA